LYAVPADSRGWVLPGNVLCFLPGRLSYVLGLEGPAIAVDTGCSASLVAMHLASQALRNGECGLALAAGVAVVGSPGLWRDINPQVMSADGRCKAFSAAADGAGFGEGVGVLVLERLSDARANGHRVLALVRGSAVNEDGASNGMAAPNGSAQQRVIRRALAVAGLTGADVDVVEAHGTGTRMGDPIEAGAIMATYGRDRDRPLLLGSIKSNIGHTLGAAGVAGVIKMVMAMRHGTVPRTLHVDEPTPRVDWSSGSVDVVVRSTPWPETGRPRRAAVSGFGMGGTNAHVVLENGADDPEPAGGGRSAPAAVPWVLSARSDRALREQAARLRARMLEDPSCPAVDVGWSLATTRSTFEHRAVVCGTDRAELLAGVASLAAGDPTDARVVIGAARQETSAVFVFPGQGSQWIGMGRELADGSPAFAAALAECDTALRPFVDWSVHDVLSDDAALSRVEIVQPVLWAMMVSLASLWRSVGVRPTAVIGHSQGEVAAACVGGALSLTDGARVVTARSGALTALSGEGGMVSLRLPAERAERLVARWPGRLSLAAFNGPQATVVSGDPAALADLIGYCLSEGITARRIPVDYASHSPDVERVRAHLLRALEPVRPRRADLPFLSTVTAGPIDGRDLTAEYWYRNLREPVRFLPVVDDVAATGAPTFIEVSPHPVLTMAIEDTIDSRHADGDTAAKAIGTLRRTGGSFSDFLTSVAAAHTSGVQVNWPTLFADTDARTVDLPTYPFEHTRYWLDNPALHWSGPAERIQRYEVSWAALPERPGPLLAGRWLLVVPADGAADDLAGEVGAALVRHGADVERAVVAVGSDLDPWVAGDGYAGIVSLLPCDDSAHPDLPVLPRGVATTMALLRAMSRLHPGGRLWSLTRGAVAVDPADRIRRAAQAQVWGLGRVAALEQPDLWGGLVDLPEVFDDAAGRRLSTVVAGVGDEDQVAIRPDGLFGRRLVPAGPSPRRWRPSGTVLVTGGTGAVARHVAGWLAEHGAERLVLVSRRGAGADGAADLEAELKAAGVEVMLATCDVTDRTAVSDLIDDIDAAGPPLTAVVHAAGEAPADRSVLDLTDRDVAGVLSAKVSGTDHLEELLADRDLDAFVLFSSGVGVWGIGGQAAYAAANAYLDAVATRRRADGLVGASIAWGSWGLGGMMDRERTAAFRSLGVLDMPPDAAAEEIAAVVGGAPTTVVANLDRTRWVSVFTARRPSPLVSGLADAEDTTTAPAPETPRLLTALAAAGPAERRHLTLNLVTALAAAVLGHDSTDAILAVRSFRELGFDSLAVVELRNRLSAATGIKLPATMVYDHPSPHDLAGYLLERLAPDGATVETVLDELDRIEDALTGLRPDGLTRARIAARVRAIAQRWGDEPSDDLTIPSDDLTSATDDELFALLDDELDTR
jgi:acyl transferase domain-containing protein/NAD(P)-dependent dehydrogenase (short-subunit alcohol dehydrogenase family)/acyl carrier protein